MRELDRARLQARVTGVLERQYGDRYSPEQHAHNARHVVAALGLDPYAIVCDDLSVLELPLEEGDEVLDDDLLLYRVADRTLANVTTTGGVL